MRILEVKPSRTPGEYMRFEVIVDQVQNQVDVMRELMSFYPHYSDPESSLFDSTEELVPLSDGKWLFTQVRPEKV